MIYDKFIFDCSNNHINALKDTDISSIPIATISEGVIAAAAQGHITVFSHLLKHPEVLQHTNYKNMLHKAWNTALECGHIGVLRFINDELKIKRYKKDFLSLRDYNRSYQLACQHGHVDILQYLKTQFDQLRQEICIPVLKSSEKEALKTQKYQEELLKSSNMNYNIGFKKAYLTQKEKVIEYLIFEERIPQTSFITDIINQNPPGNAWRQKMFDYFQARNEQELLQNSLSMSDKSSKSLHKI